MFVVCDTALPIATACVRPGDNWRTSPAPASQTARLVEEVKENVMVNGIESGRQVEEEECGARRIGGIMERIFIFNGVEIGNSAAETVRHPAQKCVSIHL